MTLLRQMNASVTTETYSFVITEETSAIHFDRDRWMVLHKLHQHIVATSNDG
jgi:hypothetical protein